MSHALKSIVSCYIKIENAVFTNIVQQACEVNQFRSVGHQLVYDVLKGGPEYVHLC